MSSNGAVVVARDVTRVYGEGPTAVHALRGVSLDVERGKLTAVMGPSGSGKSTLMHILAGLDRPTTGDVELAGTSIGDLEDNGLPGNFMVTGAPKGNQRTLQTLINHFAGRQQWTGAQKVQLVKGLRSGSYKGDALKVNGR